MAKQEQVRLNLTPGAKGTLDRLAARFGMSQTEMTSRIINWFAAEHEIVQTSILGLLPEDVEHEAAEIYMEQVKARRAEHRQARGSKKRGPA